MNISFTNKLINKFTYLFKNVGRYSLLRSLQYYEIEKVEFSETVIDYGGGDTAKYINFFFQNSNYKSVNISSDLSPTYLIKR